MHLAMARMLFAVLLAACTLVASAERHDLPAEEARIAAEFKAAVEEKNSELAYSLAEQRVDLQRKLVQQASESTRPDAQRSLSTTLAWLADQSDAHAQYEDAAKLRGEIVDLRVHVFGAEHWQTTDARLAQERSLRLAKFTPPQHASLAQVSVLIREALALRKQKKYEDAIRSAERAAQGIENLFAPGLTEDAANNILSSDKSSYRRSQ